MTLAVDASTPALKSTTYGVTGDSPETSPSNTFSPPANSLIVVFSGANYSFTGSVGTSSITDSLGTHLTWTNINKSVLPTTAYGSSDAWWAFCPSAQTSMTVSVTHTAPSGQYIQSAQVQPIVFTGAPTTGNPIGAVVNSNAAAASTLAVNITPTATGSALYIVTTNDKSANGGTVTAGTNTAIQGTGGLKGTTAVALIGTAASTPTLTPNLSTETINLNSSSSTETWKYVAVEVLAGAGGSPAVYVPPPTAALQAVNRAAVF